jgi:hypothetical protein
MQIVPCTLVFFLFATVAAQAATEPGQPGLDPGIQCRTAIRDAERTLGIPEHLMTAIGVVESSRPSADGRLDPWPWSINVAGADYVYQTKEAVISAVRSFQAKGVRSIDVGCMQVNLMHHPAAFASLAEAFDPVANARYAARFLAELRQQTGTWETATAWYHSATPGLGEPYRRRVMAVWPGERRRAQDRLHEDLMAAWAATRRLAPLAADPASP